jgi:glycosyltransferase involved in cell wall biosynthesis
MDRSRVAILIPALNEGGSIAAIVSAVAPYGLPVVVSDGSSDDTAEQAAEAGATIVRHTIIRGYDGALNSGFSRADEMGVDYAVTLDADGQHNPALIPVFVEALAAGSWAALGVRPKPARLSEYLFAAYTRRAYGIRDPLCGMKGYAMGAYRELGHFDSYRSIGTELALFVVRQHHPVTQLTVTISPREGSARLGGRIRANAMILRSLAIAIVRARGR